MEGRTRSIFTGSKLLINQGSGQTTDPLIFKIMGQIKKEDLIKMLDDLKKTIADNEINYRTKSKIFVWLNESSEYFKTLILKKLEK